jgi:hypothetical protein
MNWFVALFSLAFVSFAAYKLIRRYAFPAPRKMWAGSVPITDEKVRERLTRLWWETYSRIDPDDRRNHDPAIHWWMYMDADVMPGGFAGYWTSELRAIHVTRATVNNDQLVRHECAHDILNSIHHFDKYFTPGKIPLKQFS